jgi:GH24 family phage-related lysozyme (muramidase)
MDVRMPDGTIIKNVPEGTTKAELQAKLGMTFGNPNAPMSVPQSDSFLSDMALGAKKRALGLAQIGMNVVEPVAEAFGYDATDTTKDMQTLAAQYEKQGRGTGVRGAIGEMIGDPMTAATLPFGAGAKGALALAGVGGASGAAMGFTDPMKEGQNRLVNAAVSGGAGAFGGAAIGKALPLLGRAAEVGLINPTRNIGGKLTDVAKDFLRKNVDDITLEVGAPDTVEGLNKAIISLGDDAKKLFKQAAASGLGKKESYLAAKLQEKGGMMTRGQAAQDPAMQRLEDMARMGVLGADAQNIATNTEQLNKGALRNWAGELLANVTGSPNAVVDETTTGDIIGGALKSRYAELKAPVDAAYKAGGKTRAKVAMQHLADFPSQVRTVLDEANISLSDTKDFRKDFDLLERLTKKLPDSNDYAIKSVKFKALEKMAQRMNSKARWDVPLSQVPDYATRQDIIAYRKLVPELRARQDDIILNDLLANADDAALTLRQAPELNKAFRTAFGKRTAPEIIATTDMTDKQIADMLGSGVIGKGETVNFLKEIKGALGDNSDEVLGQIRGTYLNRIMQGAYTKGDDASFGLGIKTGIEKLKQNNKQLFDELFTPEQQLAITDFGDVVSQLNKQVRSKTNPSGSGIVAVDAAMNLLRKLSLPGKVLASIGDEMTGSISTSVNANQAIQSIVNPFKKIGADTKIVSEALRSVSPSTGASIGADVSTVLTAPPVIAGEAPTKIDITNQPTVRPDAKLPMVDLPQAVPQSSLPQDIRQDEGLRYGAYMDTTGNRTVGMGFNMDSGIAKKVWRKAGVQAKFDDVYSGLAQISPLEAEALGAASFAIAADDAVSLYPDLNALSQPRQEALLNLSYQLGKTRLKDFDRFNAAVNRGNWTEAARHLLKSQYAQQTKGRAQEVARKLLRG